MKKETNKIPKTRKKSRAHLKDEALFYEYAETKDQKLRNTLVRNNQALVTFIVNKYYSARKDHKKYREDLLQEGTLGLMSAIDGYKVELGYKFSTYACVPLTTEILTRRGWKKWDELQEGDETIGCVDGQAKWTKINATVQYDNAPLVRFGDSKWSAVCTPQHKWLVSEDGESKLLPLTEWPNSKKYEWPSYDQKTKTYRRPDTRLVTALPFVGGKSDLTPNEASILAWVLSDGSLHDNKQTKTAPYATIVQSEEKFADEIRSLLIEEQAYTSDGKRSNNMCAFHVKAAVFRKIWGKADLENRSISDLVLDLTPEARSAWFDVWYKAEGTQGRRQITQNNGEKLDAVALTAYLEGLQDVQVRPKNEKCSLVGWHMRNRTPRRCVVAPNGEGPVWCPNTECGSWTARDENGAIYLTGNTWWIRQAVNNYLINVEPMIHVPSHVRTQHNKIIRKLKEENKTFQELIEEGISAMEINGEMVSEKMMRSVQSAIRSRWISSIDKPIGKNAQDGESGTLKDILPEEKTPTDKLFDQSKMVQIIARGLKTLDDRERNILLLRFDVISEDAVEPKE